VEEDFAVVRQADESMTLSHEQLHDPTAIGYATGRTSWTIRANERSLHLAEEVLAVHRL
jgi:hypothetical protein